MSVYCYRRARPLVFAMISSLALTLACVEEGYPQTQPDLAIVGANVLDTRTGRVAQDRTVVIGDGVIRSILGPGHEPPSGARILDAEGGLLTPGLVDVHGHLAYVLGDSVSSGGGYITRLDPSPDSLAAYRSRYARAYLPFGVTTVRDVGSTESDLTLLSTWTDRRPNFPDFLPSGAALVSREEGRATFPGHVVVHDSEGARAKVRDYHDEGFEHLKLYWRLREPEFRAALDEAGRLGMHVTGHIDFHVLPFAQALDLGLRSFEHAYTVGVGAMTGAEYQQLWREDVPAIYGERREGFFHLAMTELFNQLGPENPEIIGLIDRMAETGSSVSTSLHIFAQQVDAAPFRLNTGTSFDDVSNLTDAQRSRARRGYELMADYVRQMHEAGVRLTLAADWLEPGRTILSEMVLLHEAGIPMADVFRIGTLNGARALGLEDRGTIEPGAKADLVIFQGNPLKSPDALFSIRAVVKDGRVVEH